MRLAFLGGIIWGLLLLAFLVLYPLVTRLGSPIAPKLSPAAVTPGSLSIGDIASPTLRQERLIKTKRLPEVESEIIRFVNKERVKYKKKRLQENNELAEIAAKHSRDMLARNYLSHTCPDGFSPSDRVAHEGRRLIGAVSENIYLIEGLHKTDPEKIYEKLAKEIFEGWMSSTGHKENILSDSANLVGVGVQYHDKKIIATQLFAQARALLKSPAPESVNQGDVVDLSEMEILLGGMRPDSAELWSLTKGRSLAGPFGIEKVKVSVDPGYYLFMFRFKGSRPGEYELVSGPAFEVN